MTKTTAEELEAAITQSEQDAQDAEDLVEALENKIAAGDADVTADELDQAQALVRFARRRRDGAESRKATAEAAQHQAGLEAVDAAVATAVAAGGPCDPKTLRTARETFESDVRKAVVKYLHVGVAHDQEVARLVAQARAAGVRAWSELEGDTRNPTEEQPRLFGTSGALEVMGLGSLSPAGLHSQHRRDDLVKTARAGVEEGARVVASGAKK